MSLGIEGKIQMSQGNYSRMKRAFQKILHRTIRFRSGDPLRSPHLLDGTLTIGEYSYGAPKILKYRGDTNRVIIGKFCSIAGGVVIFVGGNHPTTWVSTYPFLRKFDLPGQFEDGHPSSKGDVIIGSDVWIGFGTTVLSGVTIGEGAVVAAQSVVTRNVPPYQIAGGNPIRIIRSRFSDEQIEALLEIAWWNWPIDMILAATDDLNSDNIDNFITRSRSGLYEQHLV